MNNTIIMTKIKVIILYATVPLGPGARPASQEKAENEVSKRRKEGKHASMHVVDVTYSFIDRLKIGSEYYQ